jgi:hypothetical protein
MEYLEGLQLNGFFIESGCLACNVFIDTSAKAMLTSWELSLYELNVTLQTSYMKILCT